MGPSGKRVKFRAHRVAWALHHCRQPSGVIRHACDTPPCFDPECLADGTQRQNLAEGSATIRYVVHAGTAARRSRPAKASSLCTAARLTRSRTRRRSAHSRLGSQVHRGQEDAQTGPANRGSDRVGVGRSVDPGRSELSIGGGDMGSKVVEPFGRVSNLLETILTGAFAVGDVRSGSRQTGGVRRRQSATTSGLMTIEPRHRGE